MNDTTSWPDSYENCVAWKINKYQSCINVTVQLHFLITVVAAFIFSLSLNSVEQMIEQRKICEDA